MKRDMDFVRLLLFKIEDLQKPTLQDLISEGYTESDFQKLSEHLWMLTEEAGLVSGIPCHTMAGNDWIDLRLTWLGHDFLDSVRDPKIWEKTKKGAEAAGGFTVDLLKDLAKGFLKKQVEEYTGVTL